MSPRLVGRVDGESGAAWGARSVGIGSEHAVGRDMAEHLLDDADYVRVVDAVKLAATVTAGFTGAGAICEACPP